MTEKTFATLTMPFGDGEQTFQLDFQSVDAWERHTERSMFEMFNRMVETRSARLADVRSVLHSALLGGGKTPEEATGLVKRWVEQRPLSETQPVALAVMEAFFFGNDEDRAAQGAGNG